MKRALRIGIDARPLSYQLTGIGSYLKHLVEKLQEIDSLNYYYLLSNARINIRLKNKNWYKIEGKLKRKLLSTAWMQVMGPIIACRKQLDLFWSPRHHLPVLLSSSIKTVLTVHDLVHLLYPETMALPNLAAERLLLKCSIRRSNAIIADAISTAKDIKEVYHLDESKVFPIHPGVPNLNCENSNLDLNNDDLPANYFLFVGTLEPRKNFERIFKSFMSINPDQHDVHLVIVGGAGWKNETFLRSLHSHPIKSRIILTGYVSRKKLTHYYKNSICLLYPSIYEGFGFPILEAMSCGTPVITGNTSSMPEVAGGAAIIVDPFNLEEISDAMINVLTNQKLRKELIVRGFERAKQFSWTNCAEQFLHICESVVAS